VVFSNSLAYSENKLLPELRGVEIIVILFVTFAANSANTVTVSDTEKSALVSSISENSEGVRIVAIVLPPVVPPDRMQKCTLDNFKSVRTTRTD